MRITRVLVIAAFLACYSCLAEEHGHEEDEHDEEEGDAEHEGHEFQGDGHDLHHGHVMDDKLSDKHHEVDGEHNAEYDHEAFLGRDEASEFDKLSPEESKRRLGLIVDKIDKRGNKDGKITEDELIKWMTHLKLRYAKTVTKDLWKRFKLTGDKLSWEQYVEHEYKKMLEEEEKKPAADHEYSAKEMVETDERKWKVADKNGDNLLDIKEYEAFLHPEHADHMKKHVIQETVLKADTNKDGFISLEEFIADATRYNKLNDEDLKWTKESFRDEHDKNKDGKLDETETALWVFPGLDEEETEAKHLIKEADTNKDGVLSKEEILEHSDTFVGSLSTDYGEALTKHDEL